MLNSQVSALACHPRLKYITYESVSSPVNTTPGLPESSSSAAAASNTEMAAASPLLSLALLVLLVRQSSCSLAIATRSVPSDMKPSASNKSAAVPAETSKAERRDEGFGRFIKFNTGTQDSMRINLEFSVPFLTVPLRRNDPSVPPAPVELNVRGILMAAGLGAVAAVVVPALTSSQGPLELPSPWSGK